MTDVRVRGGATAEELAAVLAVVAQGERQPPVDAYARWRSERVAALRGSRSASHPTG